MNYKTLNIAEFSFSITAADSIKKIVKLLEQFGYSAKILGTETIGFSKYVKYRFSRTETLGHPSTAIPFTSDEHNAYYCYSDLRDLLRNMQNDIQAINKLNDSNNCIFDIEIIHSNSYYYAFRYWIAPQDEKTKDAPHANSNDGASFPSWGFRFMKFYFISLLILAAIVFYMKKNSDKHNQARIKKSESIQIRSQYDQLANEMTNQVKVIR